MQGVRAVVYVRRDFRDVTGSGNSTPTGTSKKSQFAWRYLNSARETGDGTGVCCDAYTVLNCKVT